jgi:transcriptional regulator with XRE-family HTH domain
VPISRARDKPVARAFGTRLRTVRTERGMTQEALAHAAGVHPTYVSNCERGYSAPTLETILRFADALDVRPGELVDDLDLPKRR